MQEIATELQVLMVSPLGYCHGVSKALRLAEQALNDPSSGPVHALGALIHNAQEMGRLVQMGLTVIESVDEAVGGTLIIRAHGVPPEVKQKAEAKGLRVVDGTCGQVTKSQRAAMALLEDGRRVLIYGDSQHPEVVGIVGAVGGSAEVIEDEDDARNLPPPYDRMGILCQSTKQPERFQKIVEILRSHGGDLVVKDTICPFVIRRQSKTRELAAAVDVMIVVGGRHSSNTRRLADLCLDVGTPVHHVETANDLRPEWFRGVQTVGVTSGLSTPTRLAEEVRDAIYSMASV
ncbi:MAG: 4-hydroxy-3-methylbut-2-enyl diphosphate reductase [Armatimonadota bacterium]